MAQHFLPLVCLLALLTLAQASDDGVVDVVVQQQQEQQQDSVGFEWPTTVLQATGVLHDSELHGISMHGGRRLGIDAPFLNETHGEQRTLCVRSSTSVSDNSSVFFAAAMFTNGGAIAVGERVEIQLETKVSTRIYGRYGSADPTPLEFDAALLQWGWPQHRATSDHTPKTETLSRKLP